MREYSVHEINELRKLLKEQVSNLRGLDQVIAVEEMIRTHMMAGHTADGIARQKLMDEAFARSRAR